MEISEQTLRVANRRGATLRAAFPAVLAVRYDARTTRVVIALASGLELAFAPAQVEGLEHARPVDLMSAQISPSGLGIHFPALDADIYVPALLNGFLGSSLWMAAEMGRRGGAVSSEAKAAAARENGKKGGRPRKTPAALPSPHPR